MSGMEDDAKDIAALYERHAADFDRERDKRLFERAWLDRFLAHVKTGGAVIDLGCGSGEPIARYVVDGGRSVTGVDAAPAMITLCRKRFPDQTWIVADMRDVDPGRAFDGVIAFDSFFHLTQQDQRAMFAVFARLASGGAPLLFTSGPRAGIAMGTYHGAPLFHASLDPSEYRSLLDRHGFDVIDFVPEDRDCGRRSVWLARKR